MALRFLHRRSFFCFYGVLMFWKRLPVSLKLFAVMLAITTLVIGFVSVLAVVNMRYGFALYLAEAEISRFDELEQALSEAHDADNPGWPQLRENRPAWHRFVRSVMPPPPRRGAGKPPMELDGAGDLRPRRPPPRDPLRLGLRLTLLDADRVRVVGGNSDREVFVTRPIYSSRQGQGEPPIGWIGLTGGGHRFETGDRLFLSDQLNALAMTAFLAVVLSAIGAYFLARQFLRPVKNIAEAGNRLGAGDYSFRLHHDRRDELGKLMDQFNVLAENLERTDIMQRKWVSDTSHELKTPLAVLQGQIEALQDGVRKPGKKTLEQLHSSMSRLARLVADLNVLAQLREEHLPIDPAMEDLAPIMENAVSELSDQATDAGLSVNIDVPPSLPLKCDRFRMRQLFDNLLHNSIRYTSAPGSIHLSAREVGGQIEVILEDTAPGPPEEALEQLFDRFYRAEDSRDRRLGGSGLGLSICREIVRGHGGTILAQHSDLGGLKVEIILPREGS